MTAYYASNGSHKITSRYGWRALFQKRKFHAGIDYVTYGDLKMYPSQNKSGIVKFAGWDKTGGGNMVWIVYNDGTGFYYLHCAKLHVKTRQKITPQTLLAQEGSTGNVTGKHTHHTELRNGYNIKSHHNFTLIERSMDAFTKLIYKDRPDVKKANVNVYSWWDEYGVIEFIFRLGYLKRSDVLKVFINQPKFKRNEWLKNWYLEWGSKEYKNIWNEYKNSTKKRA